MMLYAENPNIEVFMAEDVHFGCSFLLATAGSVMEGMGSRAKLQKANDIFDRLARGTIANLPDSNIPGLSYEELDYLSTRCQGWYEVFEEVIATTAIDANAETLKLIVEREADYHNFKEQSELEDRRYLVNLAPFDFD